MRFSIFLLLLLSSLTKANTQTPNDSGEIPFEMVKNTIVVSVQIKGKPYRFVLDTGGILSISKKLQKEYQFEEVEKTTISDINQLEIDLTTVIVPEISLGNWTFNHKKAIINYMSDAYPDHCFGTDGMIGRDFFTGTLLHFDYSRKVIRLTEDDSVLNLTPTDRTKLKLSKRGLPDVLLKIDGKEEYIEFDSGSGDFFSYKTKTAKKIRKKRKQDKLTFTGIFSYGMSGKDFTSTKRYRIRIDDLKLGGTHFSNFYSDLTKASAPRIGASILYYGQTTVDYKNGWFYFSPFPDTKLPSRLEMFGFDIGKIGEKYIVKWILKSSKTEATGLTYGDTILEINGKPIAEVANGCEGYLNGYSFKKEQRIEVVFLNSKRERKTILLEKATY